MYKYLENLVDVWLRVGVNIQPNQLLYVTIPSEYISLKDIFDKKTKQLKGMEVIYQFTDDYDQLLEKYKTLQKSTITLCQEWLDKLNSGVKVKEL